MGLNCLKCVIKAHFSCLFFVLFCFPFLWGGGGVCLEVAKHRR